MLGGFLEASIRVLVLIPARYQSTRFPGKPLAMIAGKSMIQRVYERLGKPSEDQQFTVAVVTDSDQIEEHVRGFGGEVCRVDDPVNSGSERIFLAFERFFNQSDFDYIINVQGDEPLLNSDDLLRMIEQQSISGYEIATLVKPERGGVDFLSPDTVKAIYCCNSHRCLYFSRSPIPYSVDGKGGVPEAWYRHIGVYSYTPSSLNKFHQSSDNQYEQIERLEQLKALEAGLTIGAVEISGPHLGVDRPEDIKRVEEMILEQKN
jgi:3-deoxy-manno-octulosonate cytidylyltransferase (CMP-KDO synthetase)